MILRSLLFPKHRNLNYRVSVTLLLSPYFRTYYGSNDCYTKERKKKKKLENH